MLILKYLVLWGDILIGRIYIENNNLIYKPVTEGIEKARKTGLITGLFFSLADGEIPPFLLNRLKNNPDCINYCKVNTDRLEIIKVAA